MTLCEQMLITADWAAFIARGFLQHNDVDRAAIWMDFSRQWIDEAYNLTISNAQRLAA